MSERELKKAGGDVKGNIAFIKPSKLEELGLVNKVILKGEFVGTVANPFTDKDDFKFVAEGGEGLSAGQEVVINNAGHLAYLMSEVSPGQYCEITYLGKEPYKVKGTEKSVNAHKFELLYA